MEGPPRMRALCCIWPMKKNDSGLILDTTACAAAYGEHGITQDSQGKLEGDPAAAASSRGGLPDASSSNGGLGNFIFVTVDRSNNTTAHRSQQAVLSNRSDPETDVVPVIDYVTDDTTDDPAFAAEQSDDGAPETAATVDDYYYYPEGAYYHVTDADDQE
ncbi:uncharacterized protein [Triticum aestivum]|uniref:uncharacterized protein isoform X5 n=1 Tax=Triticum aestivum TaxID=4565 RepID=UPI001D02198D|nr:uncharacterized protein LOC123162850 isoform X5 [Triticum aestivum]